MNHHISMMMIEASFLGCIVDFLLPGVLDSRLVYLTDV